MIRILSLSVKPGPNRILKEMDRANGLERAPVLVSLEETLAFLAAHLHSSAAYRTYCLYPLDAKPDPGPASLVPSSDHLVRLAVYEKVRELCSQDDPGGLEEAVKLAVNARLVTPVSGAVVLEQKERYDQFDLDPFAEPDPMPIPPIPEPEEWALILIAGAALIILIRWRASGASP